MSRVDLVVNGAAVAADVEPRLHLADFLRDHLLLTGTHLGCEHGVCGACTILLDGEPARSCIAFAADCRGRDVRSIEGLEDDPIVVRLRDAFTAEHALQCGFCTPGMLVTARDIVRRLPNADEYRVRLELAGNLCRCTGYVGIVRAILRVLRDPPDTTPPESAAPVPALRFEAAEPSPAPRPPGNTPAGSTPTGNRPAGNTPTGNTIEERIVIAASRDAVWAAVQDPALIASCVPGAAVTSVEGERIAGTLTASLGPIRTQFTGQGTVAYDAAAYRGTVAGEGRDATSGTHLQARAAFQVEAIDADHASLVLSVEYGLRGALAQFARGPLVRAFAAEVAARTGRNLEQRLAGGAVPPDAAALPTGSLLFAAIRRWLRRLFT